MARISAAGSQRHHACLYSACITICEISICE